LGQVKNKILRAINNDKLFYGKKPIILSWDVDVSSDKDKEKFVK
jgi:hypothetical protein